MIKLRTASVGDGACTAVIGGGDRVALIIDCGSGQARSSQVAASGLMRLAALPLPGPLTIVVSHLHTDHFNGLIYLADHGMEICQGPITLIQPRLPDHALARAFYDQLSALMLYLGDITGLPDLDFAEIIGRLSPMGGNRRPMSDRDSFASGGLSFDVLWPPRHLDPTIGRLLLRAVGKFSDLAGRDGRLREALDRVRRDGPMANQPRELAASGEPSLGRANGDPAWPPLLEGDDTADDDSDGSSDVGVALHGLQTEGSEENFDPELRDEVKNATRAFREAANSMSLVIATADRDFIAWGDVPPRLARAIAKREGSQMAVGYGAWPRITVALAPHHGSQADTPGLAGPTICLSSAGPLSRLWHGYEGTCPADICVNTAEVGDVTLPEDIAIYRALSVSGAAAGSPPAAFGDPEAIRATLSWREQTDLDLHAWVVTAHETGHIYYGNRARLRLPTAALDGDVTDGPGEESITLRRISGARLVFAAHAFAEDMEIGAAQAELRLHIRPGGPTRAWTLDGGHGRWWHIASVEPDGSVVEANLVADEPPFPID